MQSGYDFRQRRDRELGLAEEVRWNEPGPE